MSEITKMHVLTQLQDHQQKTLDKLSLLIVDFSQLSQKKVNNQFKDIEKDIQEHLLYDDTLIEQVRHHNDLSPEILKYEERKERINSNIDEISSHSKKEELLPLLRQLSGELRVLAEFEELRLHKKISRYSSAKELEAAYNQMAEVTEE